MEKNYQSGEFEFKGWSLNGFLMLLVNLLMYAGAVYIFVMGIMKDNNNEPFVCEIITSGVVLLAAIIVSCRFYMLEPNEGKVSTFFGK